MSAPITPVPEETSPSTSGTQAATPSGQPKSVFTRLKRYFRPDNSKSPDSSLSPLTILYQDNIQLALNAFEKRKTMEPLPDDLLIPLPVVQPVTPYITIPRSQNPDPAIAPPLEDTEYRLTENDQYIPRKTDPKDFNPFLEGPGCFAYNRALWRTPNTGSNPPHKQLSQATELNSLCADILRRRNTPFHKPSPLSDLVGILFEIWESESLI